MNKNKNKESIKYLIPYLYPREKKTRMGAHKDGGYVVVHPSNTNKPWDLYISAGVGVEESFSKHFIEHYQLDKNQCWVFDGTIEEFPKHYLPFQFASKTRKHNKGIWFVKKNIGPDATPNTVNLSQLCEKHQNIFLKMDIEGAEYVWFHSLSASQLLKFREIIIEFHDIHTHPLASDVFQKLHGTHYLVHLHGNNYGGVNLDGFPNVVEATYIRQKDDGFFMNVSKDGLESDSEFELKYEKQMTITPIEGLDFPNEPMLEDITFSFLSSGNP